MKKILQVSFFTMIVTATSLQGQNFMNLNFESAQVIIETNIGDNQYITTENALPGWSAAWGTNQLSLIEYNFSPRGGGPDPVDLVGSNRNVLAGSFSLSLGGFASGSISQTALVPSGTESLLFDADSPYLLVSLGGENLSYTAIASDTNSYGLSYSTYAANISSFAGRIETLTFSSLGPGQGGGILDNIQFSPNVVPEPSSAALLFLGSGILFYVRLIRKERRLV